MGNVVHFEEINWRRWVIKSLEAEMVSDVQSAGIFFLKKKNKQPNQLKQDRTTTNLFFHLGMVANI